MKWIKVLAIIALGAFTANLAVSEPTEFALACKYVEVETGNEDICDGLSPPEVIETKLLRINEGLLGIYMYGEPRIFVVDLAVRRLYGKTYEQIVFHETIHYILWNNDPKIHECTHEEIARRLTNNRYHWPQDDSWRKIYDCVVKEVQ